MVVGSQLRLFLFGPLDALQGRFVVVPATPSAGNEHVTVINLMRSGQPIKVVSCTDATTCTPISPALAMGDLFDAEVPAVVSDDGFASLRSDGSGVNFRLVPSASLPNPPVLGLYVGLWGAVVLVQRLVPVHRPPPSSSAPRSLSQSRASSWPVSTERHKRTDGTTRPLVDATGER